MSANPTFFARGRGTGRGLKLEPEETGGACRGSRWSTGRWTGKWNHHRRKPSADGWLRQSGSGSSCARALSVAHRTIAVHIVIGTQKLMRKSRGHFVCLQSVRGLAHSQTLRVFQESSCRAQRLGLRPRCIGAAFPRGISNCAHVNWNCYTLTVSNNSAMEKGFVSSRRTSSRL
jgi:hypothetical protein